MKILSLRLRDFRSYEDAELTFSDGQNYIFGGNWQGKSSIMDGIGYALFGRQAFPPRLSGSAVKTEHLVRDEAESGAVELIFSHRGREYQISRTCPRDHPVLFCGDEQVAAGVAPVREALTELLGIEPALFAAIFSSPQDDLRRVLDLTPEERRLFIESLLGFDHIKGQQARARRCRATLRTWLDGYIRMDIDSAAAHAERIDARLRECADAIATLDLQIECRKNDATTSGPARMRKATDEYAALAGEQSVYQGLVEEVRQGTCPVCGRIVSAAEQSAIASQLIERIGVLDKRCRALEPQLIAAGEEENVYKASIHTQAERDAKIRELEFYRGELQGLRQEISAYEGRGRVAKYIEDECAFLSELADALDEFRREVRSVLARDLEDAVNLFLERFSDGDFDARLSINEDFGLEILLHGRRVPLFNLSGAARDLLAISLRCGLYRIAAREIDFLLLDEPTRHLDSSNIRRLKSAFDGIGDHQLIVITVNDEFVDAVGTKYVVGKDERMISEIRRLDSADDVNRHTSRHRTTDATVSS